MKRENKQWIYIDDSGDPGFKIGNGSSKYFVIACIIFDEKIDATNAVSEVKRFKEDRLGWSDKRELKSNKTSVNIKTEFFNAICNSCNFKVRAIVIDKTVLYSNELKNNKISFYNYAIRQVLSKAHLNNAKIVIDGHADRNYKKQAISYIRKVVGRTRGSISDIKFEDSSKNNLIQIADMVAGAIRRQKEGLSDGDVCIKTLQKSGKIEDIWYFK